MQKVNPTPHRDPLFWKMLLWLQINNVDIGGIQFDLAVINYKFGGGSANASASLVSKVVMDSGAFKP
jgi:hypothetical protein